MMMKTKKGTEHLHKYIVEQDNSAYTPVEQATWRFILRLLSDFFKDHAHPFYHEGLRAAGINTEEIPSIQNMRQALMEYGWKTVPVSGFIPPSAFLEMQALGFLPIAKEMRTVDHIAYTPAPDIIHEAAGHAPYLAHPEFSDYLHQYADVAKKAIISSEDYAVYSGIRKLSDIKEHPDSTEAEIAQATKELNDAVNSVTYVSEAAKSSRLYWWTAEYGLVGPMDNPKIYGAGLLSSIGEAKKCFDPSVKKLPLSLDCIETSFDITEMQPQLYVAESFQHLKDVLQELASSFAYQIGGKYGLDEVIRAKTINSIELDSGLQISGEFEKYIEHEGQIIYVKTDGPTQLCFDGHELLGHDKNYHSHGYSTILERPNGADKALHLMNKSELQTLGIEEGKNCELNFPSGIRLKAFVKEIAMLNDLPLILVLEKASIEKNGEVLFSPDWGTFDMGLGEKVVSAFAGPADYPSYGDCENFDAIIIPRREQDEQEKRKQSFYQKVRDLRESYKKTQDIKALEEQIDALYDELQSQHPGEWLAKMQLYELSLQSTKKQDIALQLKQDLLAVAKDKPDLAMHIEDSINLARAI
tara:strand:- start:19351 stop:21102 length:1752 start_codon:yes stop_codon:yes gene_type:complete